MCQPSFGEPARRDRYAAAFPVSRGLISFASGRGAEDGVSRGFFSGPTLTPAYAALCRAPWRVRPVSCGFAVESLVDVPVHRAALGLPDAAALLKLSRSVGSCRRWTTSATTASAPTPCDAHFLGAPQSALGHGGGGASTSVASHLPVARESMSRPFGIRSGRVFAWRHGDPNQVVRRVAQSDICAVPPLRRRIHRVCSARQRGLLLDPGPEAP